jgi:hypothetical protein
MKLEQVYKTPLLSYEHDSLGENTFHLQFIKQMNQSTFYKLVDCLMNEIRVVNYRIPIVEYFRNMILAGKV